MNFYSLYLKIIRMSEKYLIKKGLFRLALIALIVNNIIIITVSKVKPRMFSKENSEYSDFVKIELDFILKELFYKAKKIKSESSMESKILKLFSSLTSLAIFFITSFSTVKKVSRFSLVINELLPA